MKKLNLKKIINEEIQNVLSEDLSRVADTATFNKMMQHLSEAGKLAAKLGGPPTKNQSNRLAIELLAIWEDTGQDPDAIHNYTSESTAPIKEVTARITKDSLDKALGSQVVQRLRTNKKNIGKRELGVIYNTIAKKLGMTSSEFYRLGLDDETATLLWPGKASVASESVTEESGGRVKFKGKKANDLYNIMKPNPDGLICANNQYYTVDMDDMRNNLQSPTIFGNTKDGSEKEIKVSDIEYIEFG